MAGTCQYCGNSIRRRAFETDALYHSRKYCEQPKCLREGRQERLESLYFKEEPDAMRNHRRAFITRALFLMRWGMEPMEAFDKYGKEASSNWEEIFFIVQSGKGLKIKLAIEVSDGDEQPLSQVNLEEHIIFQEQPTQERLIGILTRMATAAHSKLLEEQNLNEL